MAWAARAPVVKSLDRVDVLEAAQPDAIRVFRHYFPTDTTSDPDGTVAAILAALAGYRHPGLYVEVWNEAHPTLAQQKRAVALLHAAGLKAAGPSWGTGDYTQADWDTAVSAGWNALAVHAYWGNQGFTQWHALRFASYWKPGHPPVIVSECGRDNVEGGAAGWQKSGLSADAYLAELIAYGNILGGLPYVLGATVFTSGPTNDWQAFSTDSFSDKIPGGVPPATGGTMQDLYPGATWIGSPNFGFPTGSHGRGGSPPVLAIVCHIAEGTLDGTDTTFLDPNNNGNPVSAHFCVGEDGTVHQYVRMNDAAWGNGVVEAGNTMPASWPAGVDPNVYTVSVEHAGMSGRPLTEVQYQASLKLQRWILTQTGLTPTVDTVVGHYRIAPISRAGCPGPAFPWRRLLADLQPQTTPTKADSDFVVYAPKTGTWREVAVNLKGVCDDALNTGRKLRDLAEQAVQAWGNR